MAFGEKMLKLLTEEVIKKPNVIRMLRPELIFFPSLWAGGNQSDGFRERAAF